MGVHLVEVVSFFVDCLDNGLLGVDCFDGKLRVSVVSCRVGGVDALTLIGIGSGDVGREDGSLTSLQGANSSSSSRASEC